MKQSRLVVRPVLQATRPRRERRWRFDFRMKPLQLSERAMKMANSGIHLNELEEQGSKRVVANMVGLLFKLGVISILIWLIANMPDKPSFLR